jgi:non-ribosomal peptide synthetase component E (peptide arylation enzyme)
MTYDQALIDAVVLQRNEAMNALARMQAESAVRYAQLQEQIDALTAQLKGAEDGNEPV